MKTQQENNTQLVLYFQVHQPKRLSKIKFLDSGKGHNLFDDGLNRDIIKRVSENCYLPVNQMLLRVIERYPGVKVCFSISGVAIEQFEEHQPEVLESFKQLAQTGSVEFLGETYYHSLSSVTPNNEFISQVRQHSASIEKHFGVTPRVFRNTELIYSSSIGSKVSQLGFKGILCEGANRILNERNPYQVYKHPSANDLSILLRSNELSDDIAFRFTHGKGLTSEQYAQWLNSVPGDNRVITIGVDYETFGEHYPYDSGIVNFLEELIIRVRTDSTMSFATPSEVIESSQTEDQLDIHEFVSWADEAKDISAWLGNEMQCDAFNTLNSIEERVLNSRDEEIINTWRNLQTSDHFYYMSTKQSGDGEVHSYFSHYESPYQAFINYMNVLNDFSLRLSHGSVDAGQSQIHSAERERRQNDAPIWAREYQAHVANTVG